MVKVFCIFSLLLLLNFGCSSEKTRTHMKWQVSLMLSSNEKVVVSIDHSYNKIYAFPSGPLEIYRTGGDERLYDISFVYKNQTFFFRTSELPLLINRLENKFYISTCDNIYFKEIIGIEYRFKFYKSEGLLWQEVEPHEFPKEIAIANLDFSLSYPYPQAPDDISLPFEEMVHSDTFRLWTVLYSGVCVIKSSDEIQKDLISDYRKKFIDPFWGSRKYSDYIPKVVVDRQNNESDESK